MTIRTLNEVLREGEDEGTEEPLTRLVGLICVFRSCDAKKRVPDSQIQDGLVKFKKSYGAITTESVDKFMKMPDQMLDLDLPEDFILDCLDEDYWLQFTHPN